MGIPIRLQKILAAAGAGSRRACEVFITEGRVTVDGALVTQLGSKADPETQAIEFDGRKIAGPGRMAKSIQDAEQKVYWVLNKPAGVVCTNVDPAGRPVAVQLVPEKRRIFCVGRLDLDTEGLILLTNDGDLTNQLTHPRYGVEKTYTAKVDGEISPAQVRKLETGVHLAEGRTGGARVRVRKRQGRFSSIEMTIAEGMNRQVRRMLARVDLRCRQLKRVAIGPIRLGELETGQARRLGDEEVERLKKAIEHAALASQSEGGRQKAEGGRQKAEGRRQEPEERDEELLEVDEELEAETAFEPLAPRRVVAPLESAAEEPEEEEEFEEPEEISPATTKDRGADEDALADEVAEELEEEAPPAPKPERREQRPWQKRGESRSPGGPPKPWQKREGAPRTAKPWEKREGAPRPDRPWQKREGGPRTAKPWEKREGGPRTAKPWETREGAPRPDRPWQKREGAPRTAKPWEKREGAPRPDRPWQKREGGPRTAKPWEKREGAPRPDRPWQKREGAPRTAKPWEKREGGSRPARPWEKREGPPRGERPRQERGERPWEKRAPAREGGARPWQKREGGARPWKKNR